MGSRYKCHEYDKSTWVIEFTAVLLVKSQCHLAITNYCWRKLVNRRKLTNKESITLIFHTRGKKIEGNIGKIKEDYLYVGENSKYVDTEKIFFTRKPLCIYILEVLNITLECFSRALRSFQKLTEVVMSHNNLFILFYLVQEWCTVYLSWYPHISFIHIHA
jgi:hypothetical protein